MEGYVISSLFLVLVFFLRLLHRFFQFSRNNEELRQTVKQKYQARLDELTDSYSSLVSINERTDLLIAQKGEEILKLTEQFKLKKSLLNRLQKQFDEIEKEILELSQNFKSIINDENFSVKLKEQFKLKKKLEGKIEKLSYENEKFNFENSNLNQKIQDNLNDFDKLYETNNKKLILSNLSNNINDDLINIDQLNKNCISQNHFFFDLVLNFRKIYNQALVEPDVLISYNLDFVYKFNKITDLIIKMKYHFSTEFLKIKNKITDIIFSYHKHLNHEFESKSNAKIIAKQKELETLINNYNFLLSERNEQIAILENKIKIKKKELSKKKPLEIKNQIHRKKDKDKDKDKLVENQKHKVPSEDHVKLESFSNEILAVSKIKNDFSSKRIKVAGGFLEFGKPQNPKTIKLLNKLAS
ncbi:uncharacterized protein ASCRUDRAFT_67392 [Ascoidea rubescens DSM 1968]|uniref:Uncharacterized protein n=1 Tax=Ascoidea rubescens DSM 1968 TaxID=1344418 RepID=A0A1D2VNT7_9ASCO|nr:hypothetical protein ASCRUDRAFT_67392 [Ascoidea rubescens DSM 1968]ODV63270.1 hypothetical protein ASCRUDRAFT_67392 [Ascoidea rubescens DSM 1968]